MVSVMQKKKKHTHNKDNYNNPNRVRVGEGRGCAVSRARSAEASGAPVSEQNHCTIRLQYTGHQTGSPCIQCGTVVHSALKFGIVLIY